MTDDIFPVQWTSPQAVVTLPRRIDSSNADQVHEQLLLVINRGAAVLIADLAATTSCDHFGAEALARAQHRAAANGTELRLVVGAEVVRRVLTLNGLDRLVSIYPALDAALAAGAERRTGPGGPAAPTITAAVPQAAGRERELLDSVVDGIFTAGMSLQAATYLPGEAAAPRIAEALRCLDEVVADVRDHVLAGHGQGTEPGPAAQPHLDLDEHAEPAANRAPALQERMAALQERMTQTAYALHFAAADAAALLEQRADLVGQPARIDYPTEVKRWRVIADQARQMAERWEHLQTG